MIGWSSPAADPGTGRKGGERHVDDLCLAGELLQVRRRAGGAAGEVAVADEAPVGRHRSQRPGVATSVIGTSGFRRIWSMAADRRRGAPAELEPAGRVDPERLVESDHDRNRSPRRGRIRHDDVGDQAVDALARAVDEVDGQRVDAGFEVEAIRTRLLGADREPHHDAVACRRWSPPAPGPARATRCVGPARRPGRSSCHVVGIVDGLEHRRLERSARRRAVHGHPHREHVAGVHPRGLLHEPQLVAAAPLAVLEADVELDVEVGPGWRRGGRLGRRGAVARQRRGDEDDEAAAGREHRRAASRAGPAAVRRRPAGRVGRLTVGGRR